MYRAVLATCIVAAFALPASAQQKQQAAEPAQANLSWVTAETDTGATFALTPSDSDNAVLLLLCERGNPTVLVTTTIIPKDLKADEQAKITFTTGKIRKELAGKGVAADDGTVDLESGAKLDDMRALVNGGKTLVLETKGVKQQIALVGAGAAFTQFETLCKAK